MIMGESSAPKFSFGFNKSISKPKQSTIKSVEFIETIDETTLKQRDEPQAHKAFVIPLIKSDRELHIEKRLKDLKTKESDETTDDSTTIPINIQNDSLDQRAIEEILNQSKELSLNEKSKVQILPLKPDEAVLEGGEEPTEDDFENIPIEDYGSALFRGMGGTVPDLKSKIDDEINIRPRGMGLGAGSIIGKEKNINKHSSSSSNHPELKIKKGAMVKILAGPHKDSYGIVELFEECERVAVKLAIGGIKISINEYLTKVVTKTEYDQKARVLNNSTFDSYKNGNSSKSEKLRKPDRPQAHGSRNRRSRSKSPRRNHHKSSSSRRRSRSPRDSRRKRSRSRSPYYSKR